MILVFFKEKGIGLGRTGASMATEIGYSVPHGSLNFWTERFKQFNIKYRDVGESFGEQFLHLKTMAIFLEWHLLATDKNSTNRIYVLKECRINKV